MVYNNCHIGLLKRMKIEENVKIVLSGNKGQDAIQKYVGNHG
jgi:hypothetical protein